MSPCPCLLVILAHAPGSSSLCYTLVTFAIIKSDQLEVNVGIEVGGCIPNFGRLTCLRRSPPQIG